MKRIIVTKRKRLPSLVLALMLGLAACLGIAAGAASADGEEAASAGVAEAASAVAAEDAAEVSEQETEEVRWQNYNGKRLGVLTGTLMEGIAEEYFPDSEYFYFDTYPDCSGALLAGKIDAYLGDEPGMKSLHAENPAIDYIHSRITEQAYSFAFRKNDAKSADLCEEFNAFLAKCREDGTMEELDDIWFGTDENRKVVKKDDLTGKKGTIRVVTTSTDMPWSYIKDGDNVGYDIDLVVRFCRYAGYALELGDVDFAARIPAIESGRYDFTTDMNVTPERQEEVLFSDPTSYGGVVLAVPAADLQPAAHTTTIESSAGGRSQYQNVDDLEGKRIGVLTGSIHDKLVADRLPTAQIQYFKDVADMVAALKAGHIDALVRPLSGAIFLHYEDSRITWLDEHLKDADVAFVFPKTEEGRALNATFSEYIRTIRENGELEELRQKWFAEDESAKTMPDYSTLPEVNGILTMAGTGTQMPFCYVRDNTIVGFEVEIAARVCEQYGYRLQIEQMNLDGILAAVQSGRCDFGGACLSITEERKETVDFAQSHFAESIVFVVLKEEETETSFLDRVRSSFDKTFIREDRWKLFLKGIGTTLLITVLAILLGTALGFLVYMACRRGNRVANGIARVLVWLISGLPVVVLLMILYYLIFANSSISGTAVAIIAFTLVFGSGVFGMLQSGVGAIDKGQMEAALSLGYGDLYAFFRFILPQAIPHFLPAYKGAIISLIKATAVVGYIAVQDLTKMGDIVRGRTYEAFFPLIAVAIIYFILGGLLTFLISRIEVNVNPKRRKKEDILKGGPKHD